MDWEANLAAIIKHTDANLKQQFRQFDSLSADLGGFTKPSAYGSHYVAHPASGGGSVHAPASDGFASTFLRDTLATMRSGSAPASAPTSFAQQFRERQERKRHEQQYENNRGERGDECAGSDGDDAAELEPQAFAQVPHEHRSRRFQRSNNGAGLGPQMYSSPTYDMAQMMEQVRLSLKLEVDARAAIAERQLSALMQLCKATSEELDRLRVEVCATDRQLHTLDQVQSKMRQDLTTQKDIGFHLQSMCGKDESWRMQAENQLLELRQIVAAVREQGNSIQVQVQEKLSRQELLVQFNAAIEPIKAQFQATLQHQAHQLAEITRNSSSSTLLLDALTQKLNRIQSDEIVELRGELQALKVHVSRMGSLDGRKQEEDSELVSSDSNAEGRSRRQSVSRRKRRQREKDATSERERAEQQTKRDELLKKEMVDTMLPSVALTIARNEIEKSVIPRFGEAKVELSREISSLERNVQALSKLVEENHMSCQRHTAQMSTIAEDQSKRIEQQLRLEMATLSRDLREGRDQTARELATQLSSQVELRSCGIEEKLKELSKAVDTELKERKAAVEVVEDELRKTRHALEERLHDITCDQRTKLSAVGDDMSQKLRDADRKWTEHVEAQTKQQSSLIEMLIGKNRAEVEARMEKVDVRTKVVEETLAKLERALAQTHEAVVTTAAKAKPMADPADNAATDEAKPTRRSSITSITNDTQSQLASIDSMLQKMALQMQLQLQQQQTQMAMAQSAAQTAAVAPPTPPYPPFWSALPASTPPTPIAATAVNTQIPVTPSEVLPPPPAPTSAPAPTVRQGKVAGLEGVSKETKPLAVSGSTALAPVKAESSALQSSPVAAATVQSSTPDRQLDEIISRAVSDELGGIRVSTSVSSSKPDSAASMNKPSDEIDTRESEAVAHPTLDTIATDVPTTSASSKPSPPIASGSPAQAVDPIVKAQQTLASTTMGAMTEAEMARMRIEARRKQEVEARQPSTSPVSDPPSLPPHAPLARAASASSLVPQGPATSTTSTTVVPDGKPSPLARSNSVNALKSPPSATAPVVSRPPPIRIPGPATPATPPPVIAASKIPPPPSTPPPSTTATPRSGIDTTPPAPSSTSQPSASVPDVRSSTTKPPPPPPLTTTPGQATLSAQSPTLASAPPAVPHVLCEQCRLPVRSDLLTEHMLRQCIKRTVACTKCQQRIPWHEVDAHQRDCEATLSLASPPVIHHQSPSSGSDPTESTSSIGPRKKCRHCGSDVAATELFEHELRCDQMLKQCPHCLRRQKVADLQDHIENCDCRLVSCPNDCGGKFLQRGIEKHLTTRCPKRSSTPAPAVATSQSTATVSSSVSDGGPVTAPPAPPAAAPLSASTPASTTVASTASSATSSAPPTTSSSARNGKVECKFCDEEFSAREIDAHENNCDWKPKRCQHCNMVIISRDLLRHEASCKTTSKSCPHCNEAMPQSALTAHTSRCSKRPIKCIRCCQMFPADSIVAHSSNCKFTPSSSSNSGITPASGATAPRIPPPPPYPPTTIAQTSQPGSRPATPSAASAGSRPSTPSQPAGIDQSGKPGVASTLSNSSVEDRLARRSLALCQLTNPSAASSPSIFTTATPQNIPKPEVDDGEEDEDDVEEDEDEEDDDDDDDEDHLTLAQVVADWSVENVCLWLHEDVGVPDVVPRFQQRRCTGEMLLELTESDLINDYGVKNRVHRERILSAIDAIKTSDDFSDEDEDEDEDDDEEEDEDEEVEEQQIHAHPSMRVPQQRASMSALALGGAVSTSRDPVRRNSLPSPQHSPVKLAGTPVSNGSLPSSSAMLRRINSALNVEFPPSASSSRPSR